MNKTILKISKSLRQLLKSNNKNKIYESPILGKIEQGLTKSVLDCELASLVSIAFILMFVIIMTILNMLQHQTYKTYAFDLGIYMQALYTTAFNKMLFYETPDLFYIRSGSFLGVHFTLLMFVLVPIYRLHPHAETLFIIQNVVIGFSAWYLYLLTKKILKNHLSALVMQLTYLLNPHLHAVVMFPFHIEVFVPLFSLMALYYLEQRKWKQFILSIILLTLTIDFAVIIAGGVAFYALLNYRRRKKEILLNLALLIYTALMLVTSIKFISTFGPEPLESGGLFNILGKGWKEILINFFTRPDLLVKSLCHDLILKLANFLTLIFPYLPVIFNNSLAWIPLLPFMLVSFLSTQASLYTPGWHIMGCFALPYITFISVKGFETHMKKGNSIGKQLTKIFLLTLMLMLILSPIIAHEDFMYSISRNVPLGASYVSKPEFKSKTKIELLNEIISNIPSDASILVQNHVFPHVANRVEAYIWLPPNKSVEYGIADLDQHDYYTKYGDVSFNSQFEDLLSRGYRLCVYGYGIMLIARNVCPIEKVISLKTIYTLENISAGSFKVTEEDEKTLVYDGTSRTFISSSYGTLPPGIYKVTYLIKVGTSFKGFIGQVEVVKESCETVLSFRPIYGSELLPNKYIPITLYFSSSNVLHNVKFRIVNVSLDLAYKLYLKYIEVEQISLKG